MLLNRSNPVERPFVSAARYAPIMLSVLRIMTGLLIMQHGTQKLFGFPEASARGMPPLVSLMGLAGVIELVGGLLIVIGLFTRPTAFLLAGFTAVAYFMAHASKSFFPILNGGELAALYCFVFLYLMLAGAGPWSLDARRGLEASRTSRY
ncbi:DoxX family protein [Terrihabitans rhizophilus]|jgi:putative oxidoreductase|uniref:DoxX family protein n=1 Tax=Terrihabitans rhizophilus TaxID=3092662 RepID=A0ABU4RW21_9HYPH|nr:DoxX family protein [Terrihabitans sp. PJ23]MDX6807076.1 DoxX family protein [Terrihabitans sp. PJ23]